MTQHRFTHRRATAVLLAAVALPATLAFAQDAPVQPSPTATPAPVTPPTVTTTPPLVLPTPTSSPIPAPPVSSAPPIVTPTPRIVPPVVTASPRPVDPPADETTAAEEDAPAVRTTRRPARAAAPAAPKAAESAPPIESVAPVAASALPQPIEPAPAPEVVAAPTAAQPNTAPVWPLLLGVGALIVAVGALLWRRRRSAQVDHYDEAVDEAVVEPAPTPMPVIEPARPVPVKSGEHIVADAAPYAFGTSAVASQLKRGGAPPRDATPSIETVAVSEPDSADVEAMAAASAPAADRPWLELMMRPIRAGTNEQDTVVEFELTVGNTGSAQAEDVRISTWLFAAGSPQESEMEGLLIDPPSNARVSEATIAPGDGTRVEASITLPRSGLHGAVLPVVVADARYRLPDGSEGRTSASFAVGISAGDGIEPFPVDSPSGLRDDIQSRLHGELHRA